MNHMKFCGCRGCRVGMHRGSWGGAVVRRAVRRFRHAAKVALKRGDTPDRIAGVPYTD